MNLKDDEDSLSEFATAGANSLSPAVMAESQAATVIERLVITGAFRRGP
jgi:hypothetical protein